MTSTKAEQASVMASTASVLSGFDDLPNIDVDNIQPIDVESLIAPNIDTKMGDRSLPFSDRIHS